MKLNADERYGTWTGVQIEAFLTGSHLPLRLSIATRAGPLIVPLWFDYSASCLICCSPTESLVVKSLQATPEVAFDVSTNDLPYRGVRGRGLATCTTAADNSQLEELLEKYLGNAEGQLATWLLNRTGSESVISIEPTWITSWDFSERMSDLQCIAERLPGSAL